MRSSESSSSDGKPPIVGCISASEWESLSALTLDPHEILGVTLDFDFDNGASFF